MIYHSNGGFNWNDVYFMPIRLREFYWRELLKAKDEETKAIQASNVQAKSNSSKVRRR